MSEIGRRCFLVATGALLAAPFAVQAQPPQRVRRIGFLLGESADSTAARATRSLYIPGFREIGYEEGVNLAIEWRFTEGKTERYKPLAEELIRSKVELIITSADDNATEAALDASRTTPIVMANAGFPVERGLIKSLARPGGNVTGTTYAPFETSLKQFQLLKEAVPGAKRVAMLTQTPFTPWGKTLFSQWNDHGRSQWMNFETFHIARPEELAETLKRIAAWRPEALFVNTGPVIRTRLDEIAAFAIERRIPTFSTGVFFVNAGALIYYGPDIPALLKLTVSYVDRILKGANPAELPVEQPRLYELALNAKTARAIGFKFPQSLLVRADRVIE
jgi:putative ABC transport system substrate-binding protein